MKGVLSMRPRRRPGRRKDMVDFVVVGDDFLDLGWELVQLGLFWCWRNASNWSLILLLLLVRMCLVQMDSIGLLAVRLL